mmetsp:Transcript_5889/g.15306  ORF Transcript_5889/g.15306 Transcript_5889/m.15306 type:complete len:354 (-) Transcript_5889:1193-2254(-)
MRRRARWKEGHESWDDPRGHGNGRSRRFHAADGGSRHIGLRRRRDRRGGQRHDDRRHVVGVDPRRCASRAIPQNQGRRRSRPRWCDDVPAVGVQGRRLSVLGRRNRGGRRQSRQRPEQARTARANLRHGCCRRRLRHGPRLDLPATRQRRADLVGRRHARRLRRQVCRRPDRHHHPRHVPPGHPRNGDRPPSLLRRLRQRGHRRRQRPDSLGLQRHQPRDLPRRRRLILCHLRRRRQALQAPHRCRSFQPPRLRHLRRLGRPDARGAHRRRRRQTPEDRALIILWSPLVPSCASKRRKKLAAVHLLLDRRTTSLATAPPSVDVVQRRSTTSAPTSDEPAAGERARLDAQYTQT